MRAFFATNEKSSDDENTSWRHGREKMQDSKKGALKKGIVNSKTECWYLVKIFGFWSRDAKKLRACFITASARVQGEFSR